MPTVLSTKKLARNQKELLLNSGIGLVEYDAIRINFKDFTFRNKSISNAIFTSKNAVRAIEKKEIFIKNCFCVGEKTSALLEKRGYKVAENAEHSAELAEKIVHRHNGKHFIFFSGNKRRDELPQILKKYKISLEEIQVYGTELNLKRFQSEYDGILFFSPSAVQSFTQKNQIKTTVFCIGETTAAEAGKHTENIIVASKPSLENVIAKAVAYLKKE